MPVMQPTQEEVESSSESVEESEQEETTPEPEKRANTKVETKKPQIGVKRPLAETEIVDEKKEPSKSGKSATEEP